VSSLIATIPPPPFNGIELGPLDVRMYGILIALGAYLALRLTVRRYERLGGDAEAAERAALIALAGGFLGARIGYVIPRLDYFVANPQDILAIWQGGLTLFGGLAGGTLAGLAYLRRRSMDVPAFMTAIAPALPLAQAIGRWGNYFNQELYGRPTDLPWALEVQEGFRRPGYQEFATFHPTFLYESLWNALLVVVLLWIDRTGRLRRGSLMFCYLIGYGVGRAWIEALRIDTAERYLGWSRNNWVALLVIVIGVVGLVWWQRRPEPVPAEAADDAAGADLTADAARDVEVSDDAAGDDTAGDAEASDDTAEAPADTVTKGAGEDEGPEVTP